MIDIASMLSSLTQQQVDEWLSCRLRVSDIVRKNILWARLLRGTILSGLQKWTPETLLVELRRRRPDIHIRDEQAAIRKIGEEMEAINALLR